MSHIRTQIREAAVTALTGLTTTGARVYPSRERRISKPEMPGLLVSIGSSSGTLETGSMGVPIAEWETELLVTAVVSGLTETAVVDLLDTIAVEVEVALYADPFFATATTELLSMVPVSAEYELSAEQDVIFGTLTTTYSVGYDQSLGDAETL